MRPFAAGTALAASLLACATPQTPSPEVAAPPVEDEGRAFQASGEIVFLSTGGFGSSAAFDDRRIVGPSVNLTRDEEGSWGGGLAGQEVSLAVAPDRITGAGVDLHVERKGDATSLRGIWFQRRISLEFTPRSISGRAGQICSVDVERKAPGVYQGSVGCVVQQPLRMQQAAVSSASIRLAGDAALPSPPMPQFALGLVAVLPP
jgi:hypothetical protein